MDIKTFIAVGENIHCTRIFKTDGKFVVKHEGGHAIPYKNGGTTRYMPIPKVMTEGADWEAGKIKHCAAAIRQGVYGTGADRDAGMDYIKCLAKSQEDSGATYLDVNVDEFSTDVDERARLMTWTVKLAQEACSLPMSIDSSNVKILQAGLDACDRKRGAPMLNSVSLERMSAVDAAIKARAVVIASAAGEHDLPCTTEGRLDNLSKIISLLERNGVKRSAIHVDPLVFPISTDQNNGKLFLEAVSRIRNIYGPEIHIVAGLSNVSFGMPGRKLLNQVFTWLAVQAGADGGIVDPMQINKNILQKMDTNSEGFKLARALLTGEDEFGMNYITACREGTI